MDSIVLMVSLHGLLDGGGQCGGDQLEGEHPPMEMRVLPGWGTDFPLGIDDVKVFLCQEGGDDGAFARLEINTLEGYQPIDRGGGCA